MLLLATLFLDHSAPLHQLSLGAVLITGFEKRYLVLYYCDGSGHNRVECIGAVVCRLPFCLLESWRTIKSDIGVSYEVTRFPPRQAWRVSGNRRPTRSVEWGIVYTDY